MEWRFEVGMIGVGSEYGRWNMGTKCGSRSQST